MQCSFIKTGNIPCQAKAIADSEHCYFHSTKIDESERKAAQSRGGKANAITIQNPLPPVSIQGVQDVVKLLESTINDVRAGQLDVKIGNCIGVLSGQLIKALEMANIATRLEVVERAIFEKRTKYS
jgi:hypothetical protein